MTRWTSTGLSWSPEALDLCEFKRQFKVKKSENVANPFGRTQRVVVVVSPSSGSHLVCSLVESHPDWRIINLDKVGFPPGGVRTRTRTSA